ncbi:hypothetical protein JNG37_07825 [Streptococcus suis]|uniref:Uncharacterized protein n=1 Tax=Streptococcus suis TaxID=1307 RepID=A0A4T2GIC7_STRSU|nr:hypothetical protein [Streptococcus suis]MBM7270487.1 hypothetical protein [Streptococcus suis]TIH98635.1 hypothetical protein FAJ39_09320 [Streptococcus suis]
MKNNSNKKGMLITGTSVVRGVQVLVALYLIYSLLQTIVFGQEMDMTLLLMMMWSIWILEISLSSKKEKKNESDN